MSTPRSEDLDSRNVDGGARLDCERMPPVAAPVTQEFLTRTAAEAGITIPIALVFWFVGGWLIDRVINLMRVAMNRNAAGWPAPTPRRILGQA